MIKLVMCVRRQPHLSREAFDQYWIGTHAGLVRQHAATLRIARYVQNPPLARPEIQAGLQAARGTLPADFDGFGELWWDCSLEELAALRQSPEGAAALRALMDDERRFVDLSRSLLWYATEREIIPAS